jgi:glyoxylase I family protein
MTEGLANLDHIVSHLRRREEALLNPAVRRDRAQVEILLDEDFLEFGSSGRVWTRDQIFELLAIETYTPAHIEDFACTLLAPNVALITYRAVRTDGGSGIRSSSLRSSIWTNQSGAWRLRFHQGTRTS